MSRFTWILVLAALATAGVWAAATKLWQPLPVARPEDPGALDPDLLELLQQHIGQVEQQPESAERRGHLGLVYAANELWLLASQCFAQAAQMEEDNTLWLFHEALAVRQQGDFERSLEILRELIPRRPNFAAFYERLGEGLREVGELEEAGRAFQRACQLAPEAAEPHVGLAEIQVQRKDFEKAEELALKAMELDPSYNAVHYVLGLAFRGLGKLQQAEEALQRGLDAPKRHLGDPLSADLRRYAVNLTARMDRAADLIEAGQPQQAITILEKARQKRPEDVPLLNNLAAAYTNLQQVEKAMEILHYAAKVDPDSFATYINLASGALQLNQPQEALQHADRAVALGSGVGRTYFTRARVLTRLGNFEKAVEDLEQSLRLDSKTPQAHLALGELKVRLRKFQEAKEHYRTAAKLMPDLLPAHVSLGSLCVQLGDFEGAQEALDVALRLAPEHPRVVVLQNRLQSTQGR